MKTDVVELKSVFRDACKTERQGFMLVELMVGLIVVTASIFALAQAVVMAQKASVSQARMDEINQANSMIGTMLNDSEFCSQNLLNLPLQVDFTKLQNGPRELRSIGADGSLGVPVFKVNETPISHGIVIKNVQIKLLSPFNLNGKNRFVGEMYFQYASNVDLLGGRYFDRKVRMFFDLDKPNGGAKVLACSTASASPGGGGGVMGGCLSTLRSNMGGQSFFTTSLWGTGCKEFSYKVASNNDPNHPFHNPTKQDPRKNPYDPTNSYDPGTNPGRLCEAASDSNYNCGISGVKHLGGFTDGYSSEYSVFCSCVKK